VLFVGLNPQTEAPLLQAKINSSKTLQNIPRVFYFGLHSVQSQMAGYRNLGVSVLKFADLIMGVSPSCRLFFRIGCNPKLFFGTGLLSRSDYKALNSKLFEINSTFDEFRLPNVIHAQASQVNFAESFSLTS
jgi:hypothetical protein